jgi:membrane-associated phospholipid phosphatase
LIGVSTVYTKQHYVVDAIAGAALGVIAYLVFLRAEPPLAAPALDQRLAPLRSAYAVGAYGLLIALFWMAYQLGLGPVTG